VRVDCVDSKPVLLAQSMQQLINALFCEFVEAPVGPGAHLICAAQGIE
jgi:hypothetical protein